MLFHLLELSLGLGSERIQGVLVNILQESFFVEFQPASFLSRSDLREEPDPTFEKKNLDPDPTKF